MGKNPLEEISKLLILVGTLILYVIRLENVFFFVPFIPFISLVNVERVHTNTSRRARARIALKPQLK